MFDNSMTVMKYRIGSRYEFVVTDRFDEPDEAKRLDNMIALSEDMSRIHRGSFEQLWIKTVPMFNITKEDRDRSTRPKANATPLIPHF